MGILVFRSKIEKIKGSGHDLTSGFLRNFLQGSNPVILEIQLIAVDNNIN